MNWLSKEKLNLHKNKKNFTNLEISKLTNIPISNIDKIFSGLNQNPTLNTIQKIASVLDCSIDDFIDYKKLPVSPVYIDDKTKKLVEEIKNLDEESIELLIKISKKFNTSI